MADSPRSALPKVLLFDLGGVLVEFVAQREAPKVLGYAGDAGDFRRRWTASPALARFEAGLSSSAEFARDFLAEWGSAIDPADFLQAFHSWVTRPLPGTFELLASLRGRFVLACLTNTNAQHWRRILDEFSFRSALDRHFASHEMRMVKPQPEIFAAVAEALAFRPQEIAFFDDGPANVEAARRAGYSAHLVAGNAELRQKLRQLRAL